MGKWWPQIEIKTLSKRKPGNKITCKGKNIVKVADQLPVKIIWRLKDKCAKITYFIDKRVIDRHTLNKRLWFQKHKIWEEGSEKVERGQAKASINSI